MSLPLNLHAQNQCKKKFITGREKRRKGGEGGKGGREKRRQEEKEGRGKKREGNKDPKES